MSRIPQAVVAIDRNWKHVAQAKPTPAGYLGGLRAGQEAPVVVLSLGQSALAMVETLAFNADGSACTPYAGLLVTAPDDALKDIEFRLRPVPWGSDGCSQLEVHPVEPFTGG
jgi:hypothetical protein